MSRNKEERRNEIQKILLRRDQASVDELAGSLGVTPETIRSDLTYLEQKGFLYRKHGSAKLRVAMIDMPMDIRMQENADIKRSLSEAAFDLVQDDMVLYIGASSTALHLAKMMVLRKNISVFTNSLDVLAAMAESRHKVVLLGGEYNRIGRRTFGAAAQKQVSEVLFDLSFFSMDGCLDADGPATQNTDEMPIDQTVLTRSRMNVLLSDHTKFDIVAHYQYAKFSDFQILVCDKLKKRDYDRVSPVIRTIREV